LIEPTNKQSVKEYVGIVVINLTSWAVTINMAEKIIIMILREEAYASQLKIVSGRRRRKLFGTEHKSVKMKRGVIIR
jgi:hypothetical protein